MAQQAAYGATLKVYDIFTTFAYVTVAYIRDIGGPNLAADALEDTGHDSSGAARIFVPGLIDAGELSLDLFWDPANSAHDVLLDLLAARWVGLFQHVWPDATQDNYHALVTAFDPGAPVDGMLTANVTLRLTGFPILDDTDGFDYLTQEDGNPLLTENGKLLLMNNAPS